MIFLRILSGKKDTVNSVAELLLKEKLAININIKGEIDRVELVNDIVVKKPMYLLTAKTKALLFPVISQRIKEIIPKESPEIYSMPIIHMDWEQMKHLDENTVSPDYKK